jgi:hypothetical protein
MGHGHWLLVSGKNIQTLLDNYFWASVDGPLVVLKTPLMDFYCCIMKNLQLFAIFEIFKKDIRRWQLSNFGFSK